MKTSKLFGVAVLAILAATLAGVSIYAYALAGSTGTTNYQPNSGNSGSNGYNPNGMMGGNYGGMMGNNGMMGGYSNPPSSTPSTVPNSVTPTNNVLPIIGLAALIGAIATGTGGAAYLLAGLKTRMSVKAKRNIVENIPPQKATVNPQNILTPYTSVSKTLTPEERKVFDVLVSHGGKYLQKYIRAETGLSRLKTHRIVSRMAERGIVTLEKTGNTNEVHLSSWLQNPNAITQNNNENTKKTTATKINVTT